MSRDREAFWRSIAGAASQLCDRAAELAEDVFPGPGNWQAQQEALYEFAAQIEGMADEWGDE